MRAALVILVFIVLGGVAGLAVAQEGEVRFERWYRVEQDGRPIGWMSHTEHQDGDRIVTEATYFEHVLVFGEARQYTTTGRVTESAGGKVLSKTLSINAQRVPLEQVTRWPDRWSPDFGGALGPSAAARFIARRLEAGAKAISIRRVEPLGTVQFDDLKLAQVTACSTTLGEREIDGYCASVATNGQIMFCERGYPISVEFKNGARRFAFHATNRNVATAPIEPAESVAHGLVHVIVGDAVTHDWPRWRFLVSRIDNQAMAAPAPIGVFHFEADHGKLIITRRSGATADPSAEERKASLRETRLLNFRQIDAPRLARELGSLDRARTLEDLVRARITKRNYSIRLGDAASAWIGREGDCTEHAVLLCALLRREGIPARVVGGFVRSEPEGHVLLQHLWVQALVETGDRYEWIDLDASSDPGTTLTDRIALGATGVTDDSVEALVRRLGSYFGLLRIEALSPE